MALLVLIASNVFAALGVAVVDPRDGSLHVS
jgi:hypothetical protein